jgi:hypothetical protein
MWSRQSLRRLEIPLSAIPFCQGDRKAERIWYLVEPKPIDSTPEFLSVDFVIAANQETSRQVERTGFDNLLGGPLRRRMSGHVEVKNSPSLKAQDKEHVDNSKCRGGHDSEVNCKSLVQVIAQERCPSLPRTRWRTALGHVAPNSDSDISMPSLSNSP